MKRILVIGSSNTDMVIKAPHLPKPGETVLGGMFVKNHGGKGANQALAAGRLGGNVSFVGSVGADSFGKDALDSLSQEHVDVSLSRICEDAPSGVALINVGEQAQNTIVVAPGANDRLLPEHLDKALSLLDEDSVVLMQLEIPLETVVYASELGDRLGARVILNPAPAAALPEDLYRHLYAIIPNETEAELLTGIKVENEDDARRAADALSMKGVRLVIITMGAKGAFVKDGSLYYMVPSVPVKAVDTTAAGDTFCGAFSVALSQNRDIRDAVAFACKCASISVTRMGAQQSAPYLSEVQ